MLFQITPSVGFRNISRMELLNISCFYFIYEINYFKALLYFYAFLTENPSSCENMYDCSYKMLRTCSWRSFIITQYACKYPEFMTMF